MQIAWQEYERTQNFFCFFFSGIVMRNFEFFRLIAWLLDEFNLWLWNRERIGIYIQNFALSIFLSLSLLPWLWCVWENVTLLFRARHLKHLTSLKLDSFSYGNFTDVIITVIWQAGRHKTQMKFHSFCPKLFQTNWNHQFGIK